MKKASKRVLKKKNFALNILDALHTMVAVIDIKSYELVDVNDTFLTFFSKKSVRSFNKTYPSLCDSFDKTENEEYIGTIKDDAKLIFKFLEKGGSLKVQIQGRVFKLLGHRVSKKWIAALFVDISDVEEHQQILDEYKRVVDASSIVSKADLREHITYVNDHYCKVSGYTNEELIGSHHLMLKHPSVSSDVFKEMFKKIQNKEIWQGEISNKSKEGKEYIVDFTVAPILDKSGNIIEFMGIGKDITAHVEQSRRIKEFENTKMRESIKTARTLYNQDIVNAIALPALILDTEDEIEAYNEAFLDLFDMFEDIESIKMIEDKVLDVGMFFQYANEAIENGALVDWKEERLGSGLIDDNLIELPIAGDMVSFEIYINRLRNETNKFVVILHKVYG